MSIVRLPCVFVLAIACAGAMPAQEVPVPQLLPGSARKSVADTGNSAQPPPPQVVSLTVPKGTSLQVALDREVRIKKVGQPIHGRVVEPVYAFDRLVAPVGSEITGEITKIDAISAGKRTLSVLNADFTPLRNVEIGFKELVLPDGRHLPLHTSVTPDSGQVVQFVTAPETKSRKGIKDRASEKTKEAKQQAKQQWEAAMKQLKTAGRVYFAELDDPLDFGSEAMTPQLSASLGSALPEGAVVRARLLTALSSATAQKGQDVEAVLSRPLFDGDRLILPQGSHLKGTVRQVQPARRMKRNGQLRISFLELVPPDGVEQKVHATLEGVQAGKDANVRLDSEGGAEATTSKSRYLTTALSLGLETLANDDDAGSGAAGGSTVGGFKLVGMVMGAVARSRAFSTTMGAYGAAVSVYSHFIARGREVEFPKNTAMQIGIGTRPAITAPPVPEKAPAASPSESAAL